MREDWKEVKLIDACIKIQDGAHKSPQKQYTEPANGRFLYLTSKNIRMGSLKLDDVKYCDEEYHNEIFSRCNPEYGDVLLTKDGANTGNVTQNTLHVPFSLLSSVCLIKTDPILLSPLFLQYYIQSKDGLEQITGKMTGAAIKRIILKTIKASYIPLPPLPEQKRIVAILDKAFEGINQAVANAEKNLANARELFESYLNNVFTQKGEGWEEKRLTEILEVQPRNGWSPPAKNHSDTGIPVLTLSSVTGFDFDLSKKKYTSATTNKNAHYWVENGALLITRSNTPELVGHVAICSGVEEPTIYPDLIMKMMLDADIAITKFVYYQLRSAKIRMIIMNSATGANPTMKKINQKVVKGLPVTIPSIGEQKRVVENLDQLYLETQNLQSIYQQKLSALQELKQSILQKAFSGELTTDTIQ